MNNKTLGNLVELEFISYLANKYKLKQYNAKNMFDYDIGSTRACRPNFDALGVDVEFNKLPKRVEDLERFGFQVKHTTRIRKGSEKLSTASIPVTWLQNRRNLIKKKANLIPVLVNYLSSKKKEGKNRRKEGTYVTLHIDDFFYILDGFLKSLQE